jgi:small subunit ribosomal protein S1
MSTDHIENTATANEEQVEIPAENTEPLMAVVSDAAVAETPVAETAVEAIAELDAPAAEAAADVLNTDVDAGAADAEATPLAQPTASALNDIKPKQELRGVVTKVALFGAFVDVGVGVDALLHISQFNTDEVRNVADVMKVGDEVTVWVRKVDVENGRIDLTMRPMLALGWGELHDGMTVTGKVVKIERFGVFLDIGAERPGMIHVSELASGYVNSPEEVVKLNDEVTARVIKVNRKKKQIDLSRKAMEEPIQMPDMEDDNEPAMTPMELALRSAMRGTEMGDAYAESLKSKREKKQQTADKRRKEQEELLNRTLKNRVK